MRAVAVRPPREWRGVETGIMDLLRLFGWRYTHFRPARTEHGWRTPMEGDAGFVDIVAVRGGRCLAIEVKSGSGRLNAEPARWRDELTRVAGIEHHVWGRGDLESGAIEAALR